MDDVTASGNIAASSYVPPALTPNTKYYWHARAFNTAGQYSAWSTTLALRTALLPPTLNNPADAAVLLNKRPNLDWNVVAGATGYNIQVSRNSIFSLLVLNASSVSTVITPSVDLPANAQLYWRARSTGANGPSLWSTIRSFTTGSPPSIPALSAPASASLTTDYTPFLDWLNSTLPAGTVFDHYQVQVDDNADFNSSAVDEITTAGDVTASNFTPTTDLAANTKYYWHVRSFNSHAEYSSWSAVRTLRTALLPPIPMSPSPGAGGVGLRPSFMWSNPNPSGVTGYSIQVSKNNAFTAIVINLNITGALTTSYTPLANLPSGITLYWRVRANGANGPSLWVTSSFVP